MICSGGMPKFVPTGKVTVIIIMATTILMVKFVKITVIKTAITKNQIVEIPSKTGVNKVDRN